MTIQQLEHFVEVCRCGSIVLAANHCYISPAGMRLSLHRIEDELGCKLLKKSSSGVVPTQEGEVFYESALEITGRYSACTKEIADIRREYELIHVAVGDHFPNLFVTSELAAFNESSKKHRVDYRDYYDTHATVLNGIAEIGFDSGPVDTNIFQVLPIIKYPIYAVVREDSAFGKYDRLPVECLHEAHITLHDKCSNNADFFDACRKVGVSPKVSAIVGRELTVYHGVQVAPFDLIGIINIECAEAITVKGIKPMPIDHPDFYEQINMFWKRGEPLSETGQKLIGFFKNEISALPDEDK